MKTLVSFSSGFDSTYVLWKILTETDDEVTVLYFDTEKVSYEIFTDKKPVKKEMTIHLLDIMKKETGRDLKTVFPILTDKDVTPELKHNSLLFIRWAAPFINDGTYDRIVHGGSYEDRHQKIVPHLEYTPSCYAEQRLFDKLCNRGNLWRPLITDEWHKKYNRLCAILNLPKNIVREINSCDRVKKVETKNGLQFKKCNTCHKCLMNRKYIELYKQGYTLEQITDWREKKSYEYGNNGLMASYKYWIEIEMGLKSTKESKKFLNHKHFIIQEIENVGIWKGLIKPD
jgi:hypothetical protein